MTLSGDKSVRLNRIHLEDDAGKCVHDEQRGQTLVDLNRAGTPLIEIVTEPDFRSADEVVEFLKKLHAVLVHLGVTQGRMEEGEFRCDVNISLRPDSSAPFGARCEIKNLNSFRHVAMAIEYEIFRQERLYESGESVIQQTRLFDPAKQETRALRSKEEAHDYRYFPQPDLPPVIVSPELLARLKAAMPELPDDIKKRLLGQGLTIEQADVLLDRRRAVEYYDAALKIFSEPKRVATLMLELLLPACQRDDMSPMDCKVPPQSLAALAKLMADNTVGRRVAYDSLFPELFAEGGDPETLAKAKGVLQISDSSALTAMAEAIVAANPQQARQYRDGQEKLLSFFVGQLMKQSRGAANPKLANEIFIKLLG